MNEVMAKEILQEVIQPDDSLKDHLGGSYVAWIALDGGTICLDGHFTVDELEAMAYWMRTKNRKKKDSEPKLIVIIDETRRVFHDQANLDEPCDVIQYGNDPIQGRKVWKVKDYTGQIAIDGDLKFFWILQQILLRHGAQTIDLGTRGSLSMESR